MKDLDKAELWHQLSRAAACCRVNRVLCKVRGMDLTEIDDAIAELEDAMNKVTSAMTLKQLRAFSDSLVEGI